MISVLILSACGQAPWDIDNETDRKAMIVEIRNALTAYDCPTALELSAQLYNSKYSDNEVRMLYASAHGCNVGIQMFPLVELLMEMPLTTEDEFYKAMVQIFPSRSLLDSRLQSAMKATDATLAVLKPGTVTDANDKIIFDAFNIGSTWSRDRTDEANTFMGFSTMAVIGSALNRYGYAATDDPAALGYAQSVALPWLTKVAVRVDTEHTSCGLASGMLNLIDSMDVLSTITSGSVGEVFSTISTTLSTVMVSAGLTRCNLVDMYSVVECEAAGRRLRNRNACYEASPGADPAASYASGILRAIDMGWL